jgi:hypothetical protein
MQHFSSGQVKTAQLTLGTGSSSATYNLEIVTDSAGQAKGLSGRTSLGKRAGMLFSYGDLQQRCIWMKDMHFSLDIIWFDASHRVTSIVPNLSPSTYPQSYCANAQYVVELNAGEVAQHGLRPGQVVKF